MNIAKFYRVSAAQYAEAWGTATEIMPLEDIPLPRRATAGSAGYDFVSPATVEIPVDGTALIPTGIRAEIAPGWVLMLFPRSSLGYKFGIRLCNTVGIIDSDYFQALNEGHIMVKLRNSGDKPVIIRRGDRFCQGVFLPYGTAEESEDFEQRTGGFGSTGH